MIGFCGDRIKLTTLEQIEPNREKQGEEKRKQRERDNQ